MLQVYQQTIATVVCYYSDKSDLKQLTNEV